MLDTALADAGVSPQAFGAQLKGIAIDKTVADVGLTIDAALMVSSPAVDSLILSEHYIYGSQRVGIKTYGEAPESGLYNSWNVSAAVGNKSYLSAQRPWLWMATGSYQDGLQVGSLTGNWYQPDVFYTGRTIGRKQYELSDHLGNILATVSDKKVGSGTNGTSSLGITLYDRYEADLISTQDYYPGGMPMAGRMFQPTLYRFGSQKQMKDNEIYGDGLMSAYKYRMEDVRLNRFWSVDPLAMQYPWNSSYAFSENRLIDGIELEGREYQDKSYYTMSTETFSMTLNGKKIIQTQLTVTYNRENMPQYFKNHHISPEGAETVGWDSHCYSGDGCIGTRIRPDYTNTESLSPHNSVPARGAADPAGVEPTMQLSTPTKRPGNTPESITTPISGRIFGAQEISRDIGIAAEQFGEKNKAFQAAFDDKLNFYFATNMVNNYLVRNSNEYSPQWREPQHVAALVNYVNTGILPYSTKDLASLKGDAFKDAVLYNLQIVNIGSKIYEATNCTDRNPSDPKAVRYH